MKRRKADDEHLIRSALLESQLIDAVISLPLNVFYGAGLPACLVILSKNRSDDRKDKVLFIYAGRHFRELSNKNELRPQDVMRMLVHYHAYGNSEKVPELVDKHKQRIDGQIKEMERIEIERLNTVYKPIADKIQELNALITTATAEYEKATTKNEKKKLNSKIIKLNKQRIRPEAKIAERDVKIEQVKRKAEDDLQEVCAVGTELLALYNDPGELVKHARVADIQEIQDNEFNLNIPRYVDTFNPEPRIDIKESLEKLAITSKEANETGIELSLLLKGIGYES